MLSFLVAACLIISARAERSHSPLSFPKGTKWELRVDGASAKAIVPVLAEGIDLRRVTFEKHFVSCDAHSGGELFDAVTVEHQAQAITELGDWGVISIIVDTDKLRMSGTCEVQIVAKVTVDPAKTAEAPYAFTVDIVLPPAQLAVPNNIIWEQVRAQPTWLLRWLPDWDSNAGRRNLLLTETGGKSRLTKIVIQQIDLIGPDDEVTAAEVKFSGPREIAPSHDQHATPVLCGTFPLGTNHGVAKITAAELAQPVTFKFDVRSRLHRWVIFITIGLGLIVGYVIRVVLQRRIDVNKARSQVMEFLHSIERAAHPDKTYLARLGEVKAKLQTALASTKDTEIAAILTKAQDDFKQAVQDLNERRNKVKQLIGDMVSVLDTPWLLPGALIAVVGDAQSKVKSAIKNLNEDNVSGAEEDVEKSALTIKKELKEPLAEWKVAIDFLLEKLSSDTVPLPEAIAASTREDFRRIRDSVDGIDEVPPDFKVGQATTVLSKILGKVHNAYNDAKRAIFRLRLRLQELAQTVIATLNLAQGPASDLRAKLMQATAELQKQLIHRIENPDSNTADIKTLFDGFHQIWSSALLEHVQNSTPEKKQQIKALLTKHDYEAAAVVIAETVQSAATSETRALGSLDRQLAHIATRSELATEVEQRVSAPVLLTLSTHAPDMRPIKIDAFRSWFTIGLTQLAQTVLVAIVLACCGYLIFQDKFVGTISDLAAIFAWAFGIDLSVDALVKAVQTVRGSR